MPPSSPSSSTNLIRNLFSRRVKTNVSAGLKEALELLQLSDLDGLEEHFLASDAFLKPWAVFRDSVLLLFPDAMSQPTKVTKVQGDKGITRTDLLWFYTQFDEGVLRYDPRSDENRREYTDDSTVWGVIDKSHWGLETYEKHLFVWMLQTFKVGKKRNPQGFHYFELRNVCTAWEAVLLPIVNTVRASYSTKGKKHYGRLALFIEARCPSGLAFPGGNVDIPASLLSPSPYRVVSRPKETGDGGAASHQRKGSVGVLTRKHYDEAEKELRDVYPQYGGLVERPKFKHKMEEWLGEQRARAEHKKAADAFDDNKIDSLNADKNVSPARFNKRHEQGGGGSQIKRYSDSVRRSLSRSLSKMSPKEEPKSSFHGVDPRLRNLGENSPPRTRVPLAAEIRKATEMREAAERRESSISLESDDTTVVTPWPRPETNRKTSEQSVYSYIRKSNPFDLSDSLQALGVGASADETVYSPMGQLSAIPQPLHQVIQHEEEGKLVPLGNGKRSHADVRVPSYEGNAWEGEISMTKLEAARNNSARAPGHVPALYPPTRLPIPINPTPYAGNLRIASRYGGAPLRAFGSAGETPPMPVAWPGSPAPPIPEKSPERMKSAKGHVNNPRLEQVKRNESERSITRIVSKENIRSALRESRDSSAEDLALPPSIPMIQGPIRTTSPGGTKLRTYNTNLFPRKEERRGTPVGEWVGRERNRPTAGASYEMGVLGGDEDEEV